MREFGYFLLVVGAIALVVGALFDPSTATAYAPGYGGLDGLSMPSRVVNLQKLQMQMMIWQGGLGGVVAGAVLVGCGTLLARLEQSGVVKPAERPAAPPQGPRCGWCGVAVPAGRRPCSDSTDDQLRALAPMIRSQRCRDQLAERGLLPDSADG